ncbi:MAG: SAM-dependent DNA methyltransferase [Rhodocyclaceae bacterium]|nr:SAM-dependent DNA methyltransferase [Rhodocyclaceae bacterium]
MAIGSHRHWLVSFGEDASPVDGLVQVSDYDRTGRPPEEVVIMEKAREYGAAAVFFEAERNGRAPQPQAFIFLARGPEEDSAFATLHKKLWSWGRVPLLYRKLPGLVQLFRCAHGPDFVSKTGKLVCRPVKTLEVAVTISSDPWWDEEQLRNGALWDNAEACKTLLSAKKAAHKALIDAVKRLSDLLNHEGILPKHLRRKLLILSLLIAYLEQREVFPDGYFEGFLAGANQFFKVLANGNALVELLRALEERFNGHVFALSDDDREILRGSKQLERFSRLVEGQEDAYGQMTLWRLYSFKDLPVELISHIYQLFVSDSDSSVYTPPFLVRLMLEDSLSWDRLDRLVARDEIILDPSCGSGIFLVEAYKRLVLHWRSRNNWEKPKERDLKKLITRVHGIDLEEGAIELAAFSLCLALCDALEPEEIRASIKLFPPLAGKSLHFSCFFEAREKNLIKGRIGVVLGNPPFASALKTDGAVKSYKKYIDSVGLLPDKQIGYLFLHESMQMLSEGGVLCMLQQYNFLYNQQSLDFRRHFIEKWDVREILDFVSVRGLFQKGDADTKIVVVVAEAQTPPEDRRLLHATFRRSGRVDSEQGFDIDYYDLHWIPRDVALTKDNVWRTNLLGGGRTLSLVERLKAYRTISDYARSQQWNFGEGFIEGQRNVSRNADHIVGRPLLRSTGLTEEGINTSKITTAPNKAYEGPRSPERFTPPILLIREQMDIPHAVWTDHYLTYTQRIVGFCAPREQTEHLKAIDTWLSKNGNAIKAYISLTSPSLFIQKATAIQADDIFSIPLPESGSLDLSSNEEILVDDIVGYYRDLIRLGERSKAMAQSGQKALASFTKVFVEQVNAIYKNNPIRPLNAQFWPGIICQPFVFGDGDIDWTGSDGLWGKLQGLLTERQGPSLSTVRMLRIYDDRFVFLLKPTPLRYWLRSIALRDADETLADLRMQGC